MSDDEIVKDFLVESYENLDRLDRDLVGLERNPRDREALAGVFRTIHTIKGTCGFLGFTKLEKVAHVGENLLTRLRDGQLVLNPEITTALLGMVDAVRQMLKEIESTGRDGEIDYPELRDTLTRLQQSAEGPGKGEAAPQVRAKAAIPKTSVSDAAPQAGSKPAEIQEVSRKEEEEADSRPMIETSVDQVAARPAEEGETVAGAGTFGRVLVSVMRTGPRWPVSPCTSPAWPSRTSRQATTTWRCVP